MRVPILLLTVALAGCTARMPAPATPAAVSLVDPDRPAPTTGEPDRWEYRDTLSADLDGDGAAEQVVVRADVGLDAAGLPVWDDGQDWEATVVAADGSRTRVYARYLQFGRLSATATHGGRVFRLVEETPAAKTVYEVRYRSPGDVRAAEVSRDVHPDG